MKILTKRIRRIVIGSCGLIVLTTGMAVYLFVSFLGPRGMQATYVAVDYDPRLTKEAATALPIISALSRYQARHSVFPAHATDFVSCLADTPVPPLAPGTDDILGWQYSQTENGSGYELWRKLGWDPSLQYHYEGSNAHWVFDPGDGTDKRTVILKP